MKALVVFYSRTGHTKKVAEMIAKDLGADIEELVDKKNRSGIMAWLMAGRDGMKKVPTQIEPVKNDPSQYDLVLIGGPLWGFSGIAPASRTYLLQNKDKIKKAAFFISKGGTPCENAFKDLASVYGKSPEGLFEIKESDINKDECLEKIKSFLLELYPQNRM